MPKSRKHWFQFVSMGVFIFFCSIMGYVAYKAFTGHSGVTKLDIAKIQKVRYDAEQKRITSLWKRGL